MAALPPLLLVLDISALSAAAPREWLEFSRVGSCIIPQVVYEEMKFLFDRSPDPDLENVARAFNRFHATSGWQVSEANGHHPELKSATNQALTRRSRVSLAVGRCAYGLAQDFPGSLVILVSKDRSLLERVHQIQSPNLCSITGEALLQWSRTGQRPIAVSQKLQQFRVATGAQVSSTVVTQPYRPTSPSRLTPSKPKPASRPVSVRETNSLPDWFPDLVSMVSAIAALAIAGFIIWALFSNTTLKQFLFPNEATEQTRYTPFQPRSHGSNGAIEHII